jgi:integrase
LLSLRKNFAKVATFKGKSLGEIAAMQSDGPRLGAGTLQKYFGSVRWFLQWCEDEGYVNTSPAKKIRIGQKPNLYDARKPFSSSQLREIFQSPQYTGHKSPARRSAPGDVLIRDGKFWIPLIGLYAGMRLGEIVQLDVSDVREDNEILYFDINKDEGEDKTLKTKSSLRKVPVHRDLIRIGLVAYVETRRAKEPKGRLFPEIKPGKNGYYSHNFSKYFSRYLSHIGVKSAKVVFHSFRHNFTDALRAAGVEDTRIKALLGHADTSVTAIYGSGVPLKVLASDMAKVSYDLDLSHLYVKDQEKG